LAVVTNDLVEIANRPFPSGYSVLLVDPLTTRPDSDKPESEDMLKRTFFLDSSYRYTKAYNVLMDMVPALHRGDLSTLGDHVWDIQFSGTHLSMIQSYENCGQRIYDTLCLLRASGATVCGLSSVGPTVYAVCPVGQAETIRATVLAEREGVTVLETSPDNDGASLVGESSA
jgi:predicted sugar kinase